MPYLYSDEQKYIRAEVGRAMASACNSETLRGLIEREGAYDLAFWQTAIDMGWTAITVPEAHGGLGMSLFDALIVAEESGRMLAGAPFLATNFAAAPLVPDLAGKSLVALALAEGGDTIGRSARFKRGRLTGTKTAILGGGAANVALALATSEDDAPVLVLVDLEAEGVTRQPFASIDNSRCLANLVFDGAHATPLPGSDPLGAADQALGRLALHLAAEAVGGTNACMVLARDHANQRQAFGQAIGKFQAVKHSIAEIFVGAEMAQASILDAAIRVDRGDADADAYVAAARLNAIHAYEFAAAAATQIHGGIGVTWEADLHLHYRRSRSLAAEAGPVHFWEDRIAAALEAA